MIAIKTKSAQITQTSWLLFMPVAFLTTAYMRKDFLADRFKWAVTINPVDYVLDAIRTVIITGWEWSTITPGLWVLIGMIALLLGTVTFMYRRETA